MGHLGWILWLVDLAVNPPGPGGHGPPRLSGVQDMQFVVGGLQPKSFKIKACRLKCKPGLHKLAGRSRGTVFWCGRADHLPHRH